MARKVQGDVDIRLFAQNTYLLEAYDLELGGQSHKGECYCFSRGYLFAQSLGLTDTYLDNLTLTSSTIGKAVGFSDGTPAAANELNAALSFRDGIQAFRTSDLSDFEITVAGKKQHTKSSSGVVAFLDGLGNTGFVELDSPNHSMAVTKTRLDDGTTRYTFFEPNTGSYQFSTGTALTKFLDAYAKKFGKALALDPKNPQFNVTAFDMTRMNAETGFGTYVTSSLQDADQYLTSIESARPLKRGNLTTLSLLETQIADRNTARALVDVYQTLQQTADELGINTRHGLPGEFDLRRTQLDDNGSVKNFLVDLTQKMLDSDSLTTAQRSKLARYQLEIADLPDSVNQQTADFRRTLADLDQARGISQAYRDSGD
ncbi:MAG: hypothetical protein MI749_13760, partial [Desulfovibrionales bacterium]|nr:hypothetical protein [Desulfovibrionales bacterium]